MARIYDFGNLDLEEVDLMNEDIIFEGETEFEMGQEFLPKSKKPGTLRELSKDEIKRVKKREKIDVKDLAEKKSKGEEFDRNFFFGET